MKLDLPEFDELLAHTAQWVREPKWLHIDSVGVRKRGRSPRSHAWGPEWRSTDDLGVEPAVWHALCGSVSGHKPEHLRVPTDKRRCPQCELRRDKFLKTLELDKDTILQQGVDWKSLSHGLLALFGRQLVYSAVHKAHDAEYLRKRKEKEIQEPETEFSIPVRHILGRGKVVQDTSTVRRKLIVSVPELLRFAEKHGLLGPVPDRAKVELVSIGTTLDDGRTQGGVGLQITWEERSGDHVVASSQAAQRILDKFGDQLSEKTRANLQETAGLAPPVKLPRPVIKPKESARIKSMRAGRLKECKHCRYPLSKENLPVGSDRCQECHGLSEPS